MACNTNDPTVVRVSQKGQATIPKPLREKFGIETPGEVFVYEEGNRIILEPVPTPNDLHGIHASDHSSGDVLDRVREITDEEQRHEEERAERLHPSGDE
ncbi:AbrB/MazE/SpoVT family DNA-binding domain-containing protein [Halocatena salina]|uniref:AbrB/MazE/SpoVT family DNA-binding domain-containing protein n=1 Tax=Halocatena salina TaxID=2934340 RepID=A0A8T9ZZB3_9EURY|nr:AbrB/MazE/SpoVT family DNA-binding domain-containing protein [Halocatena salina]UPM41826.1 AbrB/MazE/SpoVT family DNA-binding domain-containing protein [Halocatena salina]